MPVPETAIAHDLHALVNDRGYLSPAMQRQWQQSALRAPAEACLVNIRQAREDLNHAYDRQHYHAGPDPDALIYWWTRLQGSLERGRQQALAAQELCAAGQDPWQNDHSRSIWQEIAQTLAAAHAEARIQAAYWQGVKDTAAAAAEFAEHLQAEAIAARLRP